VPTKLIAVGSRIVGSVTTDTLDPPRLSDPWMKKETVREVPTAVVKLGGAVPQPVDVGAARTHTSPERP
jgi:hypothetical protein